MVKKISVKLPVLTPEQEHIAKSASRFNVVAGGEKAGKTTLGLEALLASRYGALQGKQVAWFALSGDHLDELKGRILDMIDPLISRTRMRRIELKNGGIIDLYVYDEAKDITKQYDCMVFDDVRFIQGFLKQWELVYKECLRDSGGDAWFLSGAFGKANDFWRLFEKGERELFWYSRRLPTESNRQRLPDALIKEMEDAPEAERQQRFEGVFHEHVINLSAAQRVIRPGETFRQWCERLAADGLKVDGHPFKLDDRPAMAWIYDQIPSTKAEAFRKTLVLMKCAQVGFTVMEMLAMIYLGLRFQPMTVGMFLPDMGLASLKSSERFMPVVRTVPEVHRLMTMDDPNGNGRKSGEGNVRTRRIGEAMFVFSWTSGRATTESIPMDVLSFDEVQEMTLEQMEKTRERLSASSLRYTLMGSTANWPDSDIHYWYKLGSQFEFETECPHCLAAKPLDQYFPECIKWDEETHKYRYVCASCGGWIDDPQRGQWVAKNPDAELGDSPIRSIHFPQFLSPTITPGDIIFAYNTATDMKNFFNRKLGKPYLDPSLVPVNMEHLRHCVEEGQKYGVKWKTRAKGTYMGIDQMGNFNVVVIKERLPSGHQAIIHVEEIYSTDPFARCDELMIAYGVACCVVEINPNYNDAKKFSQRHHGKVFICNSFGSIKDDMIVWNDQGKLSRSDVRLDDEAQDRFTLKMDQFKCMQVSMARFTGAKPTCLLPDPQGLIQEVLEKGIRQNMAVLPRMFNHLMKTALVAEKDEETNEFKRSVKKIGIDPHFSYANMLCDVAWSRAFGTSSFIMPDMAAPVLEALDPSNLSIPPSLTSALEELQAARYRGDRCGRCINFNPETGHCYEVCMQVGKDDLGCVMFNSGE
ncbi:phage terminase large subunit family protein [Salmonella enterica]|nr:phage terminase large subunit family protein [Salmonella enterica]EKK6596361.1 phage terminase large subunit family protein [Salmonella enterica]